MKKSVMVSGMNFGTEFLTNLYKEVVKKGGTEEMVFESLKTGSDLIPRIAEMIVSVINKAEKFPIWKTIKLGTGLKIADDFRKALKQSGCKIGDWGNDILGKPTFTASDTETEVDLAVVSVAELGFKDGATRKDIYNKAKELGLELCPNEVGPQLRLQYKNQPTGEWLRIAMEPISDSCGDLSVFDVGHYVSDLWLSGYYGHPDYFWFDGSRWVFALRK